ncbi:unnamed protein product [Paramecium sonneborni]|uniref:Transmembrane protein n=1 Tax=Paramecium sonneborni TaxID=65129 RepID=A0A8S1RNZ1_9CILI|nr:unnamed protein product [Paramecium sonneborni]
MNNMDLVNSFIMWVEVQFYNIILIWVFSTSKRNFKCVWRELNGCLKLALIQILLKIIMDQIIQFRNNQYQINRQICNYQGQQSTSVIVSLNSPTFSQFEWMNQEVISNLKKINILSSNLDLKSFKNKDYIKTNHNIIVGIIQHQFSFLKLNWYYFCKCIAVIIH